MEKLVLCTLNTLEKSDEVPTTGKLQSPGNFDPFPVFLNKVLLKNCSRLIYLWIAYGGFHPATAGQSICFALVLKGPSGCKAKNIYSLTLYRKVLPTPDLDDCGICFKKRKKERRKEIKTIEPLALVDTGRQS